MRALSRQAIRDLSLGWLLERIAKFAPGLGQKADQVIGRDLLDHAVHDVTNLGLRYTEELGSTRLCNEVLNGPVDPEESLSGLGRPVTVSNTSSADLNVQTARFIQIQLSWLRSRVSLSGKTCQICPRLFAAAPIVVRNMDAPESPISWVGCSICLACIDYVAK